MNDETQASLKEENNKLRQALIYVEEHIKCENDDWNIKQVVRIAIGKEPKIKVRFSNLGKYFQEFASKEAK